MKENKVQLEDMKTMLENVKAMYEDTKVQIENNKSKLDDTNTLLKDSKAEISKLSKKFADMEYAKDPCKNCKGPTFCLNGQVVGNKPENGTRITALKDTNCMFKGQSQVKVLADEFGTVDIYYYHYVGVNWNTLGVKFCDDFTSFVYKCK